MNLRHSHHPVYVIWLHEKCYSLSVEHITVVSDTARVVVLVSGDIRLNVLKSVYNNFVEWG